MKLYIDMIAFYLQDAGGVTNVWAELLIRMLQDRKQVVLILQQCECNNIHFKQIMALEPKVIYERKIHTKINRYLPVTCRMEHGSTFISTYYRVAENNSVKKYILVHDFTYEHYVKGIRKWVHSKQKAASVKQAEIIICVSQNTMNDLVTLYPWAETKQRYVIYNGVSNVYKKLTGDIRIKELGEYNDKEYLLYIGSRARYKRFDFAVDVAMHFGYSLVIVGGGAFSVRENKLMENNLKGNYIHLQNVENDLMNKIYNKAVALIYPSEYEGFGLPIIEAQRAGCPVIAKRGSSVSEVFGRSEYLMTENTLSEAERIIDMLKQHKKREEICSQGFANSRRFDWEMTYMEMNKILYQEA